MAKKERDVYREFRDIVKAIEQTRLHYTRLTQAYTRLDKEIKELEDGEASRPSK